MSTTTVYGFQLVDGPEHLNNLIHFIDQQDPTLAALSDGGWFAAWSGTNGELHGEIREDDGTVRVESPGYLNVNNAVVDGVIKDVKAVGLANGNVAIVYPSVGGLFTNQVPEVHTNVLLRPNVDSGSDYLVRDPNAVFPVAAAAYNPDLSALPGGGYVVVMENELDYFHQNGPAVESIKGAIRDSSGQPVSFFQTDIASTQSGGFRNPSVAALPSGNVVVAFVSDNNSKVWFQIYNAGSQTMMPLTLVDGSGSINQAPDVVALNDGSFVIAYRDMDANNTDINITLAHYSSTGTFLNSTVANAGFTAGLQTDPAVTLLSNGFLAAAWTIDGNAAPASRVDNIAIFTPDTLQRVLNFQELTGGFNLGDKPALAGLAHGRLAAASNDNAVDADGRDIFTTTVDITRTISSDGASDTLIGDDLRDTLLGNGGADTLLGNGSNDTLFGGGGNDTIDGGTGYDTAVLSGLRSAYTINRAGTTVTVSGPDGTDTLTSVERLQFDDGYMLLSESSFSDSRRDFGSDGKSDILWRQDGGLVALWQMNGAQVLHADGVASIGPDWHIAGSGDFNGDGRSDILWRQDGGLIALWQMNGAQVLHADGVASIGPDWHIAGTGDFNGDGRSDILWRQDGGLVALWQMNGAQVLHADGVASIGPDWHIAGTGDFNGDGRSDILWRQDSGLIALWQMNGAHVLHADSIASIGPDWHIAGVGDFSGDGKSDILWRQDSGLVALWQMNGAQAHGDSVGTMGPDWQIAGIGDFNGDSKSDILWRQDSGLVALWQMNGAQVLHTDSVVSVGSDWQLAGQYHDPI